MVTLVITNLLLYIHFIIIKLLKSHNIISICKGLVPKFSRTTIYGTYMDMNNIFNTYSSPYTKDPLLWPNVNQHIAIYTDLYILWVWCTNT